MVKNRTGQSSLEFILVLGFLVIPALIAGTMWINAEWRKNECAHQNFKNARIKMIHTQTLVNINGIELIPLEDLDPKKNVVSPLLEELYSSSPF